MAEPFLALVTPITGGQLPVDPGYGQGRPMPPHVGGGPVYPGGPTDPGYGVPGQPIIWPKPPEGGWQPPSGGDKPGLWPPSGHPGHPLPPEPPPSEGSDGKPEVWPPNHHPGQPLPPVIPIEPGDKPPQEPGTIWPPVEGLKGDAVILVWVPFVGFRWIVVDFDNQPATPQPVA